MHPPNCCFWALLSLLQTLLSKAEEEFFVVSSLTCARCKYLSHLLTCQSGKKIFFFFSWAMNCRFLIAPVWFAQLSLRIWCWLLARQDRFLFVMDLLPSAPPGALITTQLQQGQPCGLDADRCPLWFFWVWTKNKHTHQGKKHLFVFFTTPLPGKALRWPSLGRLSSPLWSYNCENCLIFVVRWAW